VPFYLELEDKSMGNGQKVYEDYFARNVDKSTLKNQAVKGGLVSLTSRTLSIGVHLIGVMILARLLSPDDFGLVAMASVFTNIFFVFQDVGLTDATIQAEALDHNIVSTLFWINSGIGLLIAIILAALAPLAVLFFKRKELLPILLVLSTGFIFWGLSVQHLALLKRRLLFFKVSVINILSHFMGIAAAVLIAIAGMKYWALVLREVTWALFTFILTWLYCQWRPGLPSKSPEVKKLLRFGANSVGFYIFDYFSKNMDKTIIGKRFGSEPLGFYSRACYIAVTPSAQLSGSLFHVAVSTLSKLREDKKRFLKYYSNAISLISFIGMPFSSFIVVMNKELVYILLGPKWGPTAELFGILGLSAGSYIIYQTSGWLHVSLGRSDRWLKWGIFNSIILIAGFFLGLIFGINGVAWALSLSIIALTTPSILYAGRPVLMSLSAFLGAISNNTVAAIISGVLFWQIKIQLFDSLSLVPRVTLSIILYIVLYLLILALFSRGFGKIHEYLLQIKSGLYLK